MLNASIRWQEEERQRIAADLHDDAGPLLATARLYLNENLVHQEMAVQIQSIYNAIDPLLEFNPSFIDVTYHREDFVLKKRVDGTYDRISTRKRPGTVAICDVCSVIMVALLRKKKISYSAYTLFSIMISIPLSKGGYIHDDYN